MNWSDWDAKYVRISFDFFFHWFWLECRSIQRDRHLTIFGYCCCCCGCCFRWWCTYLSLSQFCGNRLKGLFLQHVCATKMIIHLPHSNLCKFIVKSCQMSVWKRFDSVELILKRRWIYRSRAAPTAVALNFNIKYYKLIDTEMVNTNTEHDNRNFCFKKKSNKSRFEIDLRLKRRKLLILMNLVLAFVRLVGRFSLNIICLTLDWIWHSLKYQAHRFA